MRSEAEEERKKTEMGWIAQFDLRDCYVKLHIIISERSSSPFFHLFLFSLFICVSCHNSHNTVCFFGSPTKENSDKETDLTDLWRTEKIQIRYISEITRTNTETEFVLRKKIITCPN